MWVYVRVSLSYAHVCVCVRARDCVCVCECVCVRVCKDVCVCMWVCVRERQAQRKSVRVRACVCERETECACACVYACKRERERERERMWAFLFFLIVRKLLSSAETLETIVHRCDNKGMSFSLTHTHFLSFFVNSQNTHELMLPRLRSGAESWVMSHESCRLIQTDISELGPCAPIRQDSCPRGQRGMTYTRFNTHPYRTCAHTHSLFHTHRQEICDRLWVLTYNRTCVHTHLLASIHA